MSKTRQRENDPSSARDNRPEESSMGWRELVGKLRQAFSEFLTIPSLIVLGFFALAVLTSWLDTIDGGPLKPLHSLLQRHFFRKAESTGQLLGTIATGMTTVTSITFSLLLLTVQQSASSMTNQVFDQFLRRRLNQWFFGYFVGLTLYALIVLASVDPPYNPVFGASAALLLTFAAMALLVVILYATIDQMRPATILEEIHDRLIRARYRQRAFLRNARSEPILNGEGLVCRDVRAEDDGFLLRVDADAIAQAASERQGRVEVVIRMPVGGFASFHDVMAEVRADRPEDADALVPVVLRAMPQARQRDLDTDPAYGLEQIHTIGWTTASTAKQNLAVALLAIRSLRDILARWSEVEWGQDPSAGAADDPSPLVYDDDVPDQLLDVFESMMIVASESMQHQTLAEIVSAFAILFSRLPDPPRDRIEAILRRMLTTLADHVPSRELERALHEMIDALTAAGRIETARSLRDALNQVESVIGQLSARGKRGLSN